MTLPKFAIQRPVLTAMFFVGVIIIGIITFNLLPVEMMPNVSFGHITIYVNVRGGIPAVEVEKRITKIVEGAVGSVTDLKNMLTISKEGNATIILEFEPGADMDFAALEVREKFGRIRNKLPEEIDKPVIAKYAQDDVPIVIVAITSPVHTPEELRKIVNERIKDKLQRVKGVAKVDVAGGREGKIIIEVNNYSLRSFSLPIQKIVDTINVNNVNLLAGEIKRAKNKSLIRTMGEATTLADIENLAVAVTEEGSIVKVSDVAKVTDSYLDPVGFSRVNAKPSVSLYIQKESLANTVEVAKGLKKAADGLRKKLGKNIEITFTSNQADDINQAIERVKRSLLLGALLAFSILFLFLRDRSLVFIIGVAIPLSVFLTFTLMLSSKLSLNLMTLCGLALGVGMLVDNSIVVIENVFKKLENFVKQDQQLGITPVITQATLKNTAQVGTEEMLLAIVASTITTLAVFIPLVFINPESRMLYSGLALTISFSLCASLLLSLSLVPMLVSRLKKINLKKGVHIPLAFKSFVEFVLQYRYIILLGVVIFSLVALRQGQKLEKEFIGVADQNNFTAFVELPTGTQLEITDKIVSKAEAFISKLPEVKTVTSRVESWSSKIYIDLHPLAKRKISTQEVIEKIRPYTDKLRPAFIYFEEPEEVGTKEILIEIFGYNYETLKDLAIQTGSRLRGIPKFTDTKIRMREGRPELLVTVEKEKASLLGLTVHDLAMILHAQLRGLVATRYRGKRGPMVKGDEDKHSPTLRIRNLLSDQTKRKKEKEIETIVRMDEDFRDSFEKLRRLSLVTENGDLIYLSQVANFDFAIGPSEVWRKNKSRMVQVSANTGGTALETAAKHVKRAFKDIRFPKDYFWQFGGNYDKMVSNQKEFKYALILSALIIFMILASLFESFIQPLIIIVSVPLAGIGAIFALRLTDKPVSIGVLFGGIMLMGIAVNNAIILVDRINSLKKQKGFSQITPTEIVSQASFDRVRPIIMTSLTTIASMLFMALDRSESSNLWSPLAITVIGGMIVSTLLTLFVVPCLYMILEDIKLAALTKKTTSKEDR